MTKADGGYKFGFPKCGSAIVGTHMSAFQSDNGNFELSFHMHNIHLGANLVLGCK